MSLRIYFLLLTWNSSLLLVWLLYFLVVLWGTEALLLSLRDCLQEQLETCAFISYAPYPQWQANSLLMELLICLYKCLQTVYHRTLATVILYSPVDSPNFSLDEETKVFWILLLHLLEALFSALNNKLYHGKM